MTRKDLAEKRIKKLDSMEQALELISLLDYDECIAVLKGVKHLPTVMYKALMERAKAQKGVTLDLIPAGLQAIVN